MKILSSRTHGYLDYLTVAVFAAAPTLLGLTGMPMILAYMLAIIHLLMTILTNFSMGIFKLIPLRIHGVIEFIVGIAIPAIPFILKFEGVAFNFYLIIGILIFIIGLITNYEDLVNE
ncbi:hypothetical protein [Anaeromicrobium sediminis]|uniref:Uncharacterized protein n=1 Tax=Anaeromicrobium sediminis TaxID=1478221 RepID=A0A267MCV8_9FIRM|nr:hypothetical protein [Anaeromicrobium sediminis]PAB57386.1 hypothetical protein CCE28_19000 [Anaeromicrobium sediminis]